MKKKVATKKKPAPKKKVTVAVEEGVVLAGKKTYPRVKERVKALVDGKNLTEADAKEAVHAAVEKEGYTIGQLIQYYDDGLRAGYLADVPSGGQVWVQPIGPRGAELPTRKHVKLENVVAVLDGKFAPQEIQTIMADKTKKASKKIKSNAAPKSKAASTGTRGRKSQFAPDAKIKVLAKENPKRKASASFKRFELYSKVATVAEFLKAGGTGADLTYDAAKEYIKVA